MIGTVPKVQKMDLGTSSTSQINPAPVARILPCMTM